MTGIGGLQVVLEVTVFGEDVVERLVHDVVGRGMDERCVLIDERGVRFLETNKCGDLAAWMTSSSGIVFLLGVGIQAIFCREAAACCTSNMGSTKNRFMSRS